MPSNKDFLWSTGSWKHKRQCMLSFYVNISWPWFASELFKTDSSPSAYISWLSEPHIFIDTSAPYLQVLIYPFNIIHTKVTIMDNIKEQFTFHTASSISAVYLSTVNFNYDNAWNLNITTLDLHQRIFLLTWSHTEFSGVWIWMQIQLHNCFVPNTAVWSGWEQQRLFSACTNPNNITVDVQQCSLAKNEHYAATPPCLQLFQFTA